MTMKIEEQTGAAFLTEYDKNGTFINKTKINGTCSLVEDQPYIFLIGENTAKKLAESVGAPEMIYVKEKNIKVNTGYCTEFSDWKNTNSDGFTKTGDYIEYGFKIQAKGY